MMYDRIGGGGEKSIEPGFKIMKYEVNPNVLVVRALARQDDGTVPVGSGFDRRVGDRSGAGLCQLGVPRRLRLSQGGAPILLASACPVAKASISPLAHEFIKTIISSNVQTVLAKEM